MSSDAWFVLTALPVLDPPGAVPPLALADLVEQVPPGRPLELVRCVILSDDLMQREAVLAGELAAPEPAVLSLDQLVGIAPLPDDFVSTGASRDADAVTGEPFRTPADVLWGTYFRYATAMARRLESEFLFEWVGSEVAVRNALATARARVLGLDPARCVVARDLEGGDSAGAEAVVAALAAAPDPLAALRELITLRWRWVEQHEPNYSFGDDEFASYAARLVLLHRWQRSTGGEES